LIITLFACGLIVGLLSSFFGVGGGVIMVPALYFLFPNLPAQAVIGVSLGVAFFNSLLNIYYFSRLKRRPNFQVVLSVSIPAIIGVLISSQWAGKIDPLYLKIGLCLILLYVAFKNLLGKMSSNKVEQWSISKGPKKLSLAAFIGLCGGLISGLSGLGGGVIFVPLYLGLFRMPFSWVPVYSCPSMALTTLTGVLSFALQSHAPDGLLSELGPLQLGYINFGAVLLIFAGTVISSSFGARLTTRISQNMAKKVFGTLLLLIAVKFIYSLF
jgi:uncharacterized protein